LFGLYVYIWQKMTACCWWIGETDRV